MFNISMKSHLRIERADRTDFAMILGKIEPYEISLMGRFVDHGPSTRRSYHTGWKTLRSRVSWVDSSPIAWYRVKMYWLEAMTES